GDRVGRLVVATKAGLARVDAAVVVDASGDADVCHFAGLGHEWAGELEPAQTLTTSFRMVNVDSERRRTVGKDELHRRMREAAEGGGYELPRRDGSDPQTPGGGMAAPIMTRLGALPGAEMAGPPPGVEYGRFLVDQVPGYGRARLVALGTQVGVRETRRVHGDARLTADAWLSGRQLYHT